MVLACCVIGGGCVKVYATDVLININTLHKYATRLQV